MNWLERLKNQIASDAHATNATNAPAVAFVAYPSGTFRKFEAPKAVAANDSPDPDRWCWPHGPAMNGAEIDTFTARLARFTDRGLGMDDAEALADRLVIRDREGADRRLCLECTHLHGVGRWRCGNWQQSAIAIRANDVQLPDELARQLQRCGGFNDSNQHRTTP